MLSGYLNGHLPLATDEALLLVQESFVDAASVANLEKAAPEAVPAGALEGAPSLLRRIAMGLVALLAVEAVVKVAIVILLAVMTLAMRPEDDFGNSPYGMAALSVQLLAVILQTILFWFVLFRWQRDLESGQPGWALTCPPMTLAALLAAALVAFAVTPWSPMVYTGAARGGRVNLALLVTTCFFFVGAVRCLVWLWWCDGAPRTPLGIVGGLGSWIAWCMLMSVTFLGGFVQLSLAYYQGTHPYGQSFELFQMTPAGLALPWRLSVELPPISGIVSRVFGEIAHLAGTVMIAGSLYFIVFVGGRKSKTTAR
jgi:hypothetical protein